MNAGRMKPFDAPVHLSGVLGASVAASKDGVNTEVQAAIDETTRKLVAEGQASGEPTPDPELAEIIAATMAIWSVDASKAEAWEEARARDRRRENLRTMGASITDADRERIVWGKADTYAVKVVRAFLLAAKAPVTPDSSPKRFCWLAGPRGYGKTVAAGVALAEERGRYMMADQLRRAYCQETPEARDLREYATNCHLLVLDDMGTEKTAAEIAEARFALFQLVHARQGKGRLTILTGNLSEADIRRIYDSRSIDRITHQGAIVTVKGRDMRAGAQQRLEGVQ